MNELNAKMTTIANEIRELSGGTEKIGLDAMAADVSKGNEEIALQKELLEQAIAEMNGKVDPELYNQGYGDGVKSAQSEADAIISDTLSGDYYNDRVTVLGRYAFIYCAATSFDFPNVVETKDSVLLACTNATFINLPKVKILGQSAIGSCVRLEKIELPSCEQIGSYVFSNDSRLKTIILSNNIVSALDNTNAFTGTPIANGTGFVYVPVNLVGEYKAATNWSTFASQIKPISELGV